MRPLPDEDWTPVKNGDPLPDEYEKCTKIALRKEFVRAGVPARARIVNFMMYVAIARKAITRDFCNKCKNGLICKSQLVRIITCGTCSRRFLDISEDEGPAQLVEVAQRCQGFHWERAQKYAQWECDVCGPHALNILDKDYAL